MGLVDVCSGTLTPKKVPIGSNNDQHFLIYGYGFY